jgi:Domain of unknown function (DUF4386)
MEASSTPESTAKPSPLVRARVAGILYALVFVTGSYALIAVQGRVMANVIASVCYVAVTVLFYDLFKPVSRTLSMVAAGVSLLGCVFGALSSFGRAPFSMNPLVLFGIYCLLIGYLIWQSHFLPRALGVLMAFGGVGWLTFLSPALAKALFPYNLAPGILGEGALTLWLLVKGVDARRWRGQAAAGQQARSRRAVPA